MTKTHVIVFGNEKGGSGKSTAAMHTAVGLMRLGYRVGTLDLDSHQATLTNYMKNRIRHMGNANIDLPMPEHIRLKRVENRDLMQTRVKEQNQVEEAINKLSEKNDMIVIDTPGSDRFISIMGHSYADTLVTPVNDSFVDLDLLAKINPKNMQMIKASIYSEMVLDLKKQRLKKDGVETDWIVMRNRLSHLDAQNKRSVGDALEKLSPHLGFRLAPGFGDRVIFREMFLQGLTLLDIKETGRHLKNMSNLTARQEVRQLVKMVLPEQNILTLSLLGSGTV